MCGQDVVAKLLGNSPGSIQKNDKDASPIELLPLGTPQILVYGTEDQVVPLQFGKDYLQVAKKAGDSVKLVIVEGAAHHEYTVPNSVAWPQIKAAVLSLVGNQ
jgi:pimeloyl-ACP methyl ester carboxylesterase